MRKCLWIAGGLISLDLVGCAPSPKDLEAALQWSLDHNAATIADKSCGFTTFGLEDVRIDNLKLDGKMGGSATVSGKAKSGMHQGQACSGNITFRYAKGRSVTQGAGGESVGYTVVILDANRVGG